MLDDPAMQSLNRQWRGKDRPTDVLSFSQLEGPAPPSGAACTPLGDLVVSYDTAARQAAARRASLDSEVVRLLIHGVLHLLGHDHVHGGLQARRMRREERRLERVVRRHAVP